MAAANKIRRALIQGLAEFILSPRDEGFASFVRNLLFEVSRYPPPEQG
jgi:hypothetical protein